MGTLRYISTVFVHPLRYTDPTGHWACGDGYDPACAETSREAATYMIFELLIVRREAWGSYAPGSNPGGFSEEVRETLYSDSNPGGYYEYEGDLANIYNTAVIHHSGGENNEGNTSSNIEQSHMREKGRYDIGYHFIIGSDGTIYEGRDIGARGVHVDEANTGKVGIVLLGNFNESSPTQAQIAALLGLLLYLDAIFGIDDVGGHNDFNATDCPGENADEVVKKMEREIE